MPSVTAAPATDSSSCHQLLDVLEAEAGAVCGNSERIETACAALRESRTQFRDPSLAQRLPRLAHLVSSGIAGSKAPIVALLCELAETAADAWPLLEALLDSHDPEVVALALETLGRLADADPSLVDDRVLGALASHADRESGPFTGRATLMTIAKLLQVPAADLYARHANLPVRRLAARLLDLSGSLPSADFAATLLGAEAATWLRPYLAWTRATHLDLLAIASGAPPVALESLREGERVCGAKLLREIVGEIGWPNLNFGLAVQPFAGISVGGSFPLLLRPPEEVLLENVEPKRRLFDRLLIVAYGGEARSATTSATDSIARFRAYNLAHAELLADFLDVRPLTAEKVRLTVERMDRIVADFQALFASHTDECPALAAIYGDMKAAIERVLATEQTGTVSAELTRLVEMFEDPRSLREVHTLHGLKRYLHQRGLKLGMQLAETGGRAGRTVTLALAAGERLLQTSRTIEYVDFEEKSVDGDAPPYAVRLVIDEFGRQLVHAQQPLPKVRVFCYGNEVHYFIAYRNHPAFVRIDYSPPARGGMIDLAYFGVSKYELDAHPDPSLPAIERFFRRLDFDITIDKTQVHARYDKERAFDLADLCDKAASLFRLAPYLMDVDWIIGDLALSASARSEVAEAWAGHFAAWGVLPCRQLLTSDRRGVLAGVETDPAGERELRWDGTEPYRDCFSTGAVEGFSDRVRAAVEQHGLRPMLPFEGDLSLAQLAFEQRILRPLRQACASGEIVAGANELRPQAPERFQRRHGAECLLAVLRSDRETIGRSVRLAGVVTMLARGLRFRTIGAINGYEVQQATLPLPGCTAALYVLRDRSGIIRLALYASGDSLHVERRTVRDVWRENWSVDAASFVALLRRANYPTPWLEPPADDPAATAARIVEVFRNENPRAAPPPLPGERVVPGVAASPGRAVGPARLGLTNRQPADVDGTIVISPSMTPADGAFLASSAGVVSTGGGALSHAGLLALQYGKPALIVTGTWERSGANVSALLYRTLHYDEESAEIGGYRVTQRRNFREREERLHEGDLVVVDADEGILRILGSEPEALALHDSLRHLGLATRQLSAVSADAEILTERGRRLHARHQLEKVLGRVADPILARHAVSELLLRDDCAAAEKEQLLGVVLGNRAVGEAARQTVRVIVHTLTRRLVAAREEAMRLIPTSQWPWEILSLRLDVLRLALAVASVSELVKASGMEVLPCDPSTDDLDKAAGRRLRSLRAELIARAGTASDARLRHLVDELDRLDLVLGTDAAKRADLTRLQHRIGATDPGRRRILDAGAGGIEIRNAAGNKAANLAQVARLGEGALVPPWFVVTDCAFREVLESPAAGSTVRRNVESVVARTDLTNAQKASLIRDIWSAAELPPQLVDEIRDAYANLGRQADEERPFVAVRSSSSEEDLESAARAGEFDTFLFVSGEEALFEHLKRAWSGLWSERALHNRALFGTAGQIGGGVLVQKMVASAASGVLHTVNVAERRLREMVINAGLGLGEGIVSGVVAADRIVVSKEGDLQHGELQFRYLTAEKRERVVFNSRVGSGTARVETLYHQRLRPALEYVQICELVRAAARLEAAYGYPLDIEFAIEGTALRLLQVRPIPTPFAVWRETVERWQLRGG